MAAPKKSQAFAIVISALVLGLWSAPANAIPVAAVAGALASIGITSAFVAVAVTVLVNLGLALPAITSGGIIRPSRQQEFRRYGLPPIGRRWWFHRFLFGRATGLCMEPLIADGCWFLIDTRVCIRQNDLVVMKLTDSGRSNIQWMGKRFCYATSGTVIVETTNPRETVEASVEHVAGLYRVRFVGPSLRSALGAMWRVMAKGAHDERLAEPALPRGASGGLPQGVPATNPSPGRQAVEVDAAGNLARAD